MTTTLRLMTAAFCLAAAAKAQFRIADREVQIHAFAQQGYAYSDQNNFLTMRTDGGSFAMTDGGVNISSQITDRFRVGAQAYTRNIGALGNGRVELDWAYGDYKFADWLGIRAGKVKTALGLFNDTQDMEFLHTWALLPQSMYPLDLRSSTIAHVGGDVYGNVVLPDLGSLSYTAYAGTRPDDPRGGYRYVVADYGLRTTGPINGYMWGGDIKWNTPLQGMTVGASMLTMDWGGKGIIPQAFDAPWAFETKTDRTHSYYFDYQVDKWHFNGEYRRNWNVRDLTGGYAVSLDDDIRSWFVSAAYRVHRRLEIGSYYSRFINDWRFSHDDPANRIFDYTVTARFEINRYVSFKTEGHFMDGYGDLAAAHGFYQGSNPGGLKPSTNMLVLRLGFSR